MSLDPIRHILCPTDYSAFAERALEHAVALAQCYDARLTVLHCYATDAIGLPPVTLPEEVDRARRADELRLFAWPVLRAGRVADLIVREGNPAREIVNVAGETLADLVVMGTHGRRGLDRWVLGSVTEAVLRKAECPVLTVSRAARAGEAAPFRNILCAVDLSDGCASTVDCALSLAHQARARVALVHVLEDVVDEDSGRIAGFTGPLLSEYCERRRRWAKNRIDQLVPPEARGGLEIEDVVTSGKAHEAIRRVAGERGSDIIVMGVHGRAGAHLPLSGSTAAQVIRGVTCPVLTVRGPARKFKKAG